MSAASLRTIPLQRHDPAFDFSSVALEYAKAVETELNALIFPALRRMYSKGNPVGRHTHVDGRPLDLGAAVPHQTLGTVIHLLENNDDVRRGINGAFPSDARYILGTLPIQLKPVADLRNPAAHSTRLSREEVSGLRDQIVGIGQEGIICAIARVRLRAR